MSDKVFIFIYTISFLVAIFLVIPATIKKRGLWGVNLGGRYCENCRNKLPFPCLPKSFKQAWNGNRDCLCCKAEIDIWGKKISDYGIAHVIDK
jgi:hypothetical protein